MTWWAWAGLSAVAAAATTILAKVGVTGVPSTSATAIRTIVVLVAAWGLVVATREHRTIAQISRRPLVFLLLSGVATGLSWLAYFRALQMAPVTWVSPIDELSLPLSIAFAALLLGERVTWQIAFGVALMTAGALVIWHGSAAP